MVIQQLPFWTLDPFKALSDEIERLELEQLKQKKVLKTVESSLKKFEKKLDSGSQDFLDTRSHGFENQLN